MGLKFPRRDKGRKRVAYLFGAGATHAVLKAISPDNGLLTTDIQDYIRNIPRPAELADANIWNAVIDEGNDVEHVISILESQYDITSATELRKLYRRAIIERAKKYSKAPPPNNLYAVLFALHESLDSALGETLSSFVTFNYEDILERTIQQHFDRPIDYIIQTTSKKKSHAVKVFKLHGSFSWLNQRPIAVTPMSDAGENPLWIPPGVDKRRENYPFNYLWGQLTEELLSCDVLRVIGCSLSRNDWGLIPILYTVQSIRKSLEIEIIDFPKTAAQIRATYRYLKIRGLDEIPEMTGYYARRFKRKHSDPALLMEVAEYYKAQDKINPFSEWLDAKLDGYVYRDEGKPKALTDKRLRSFYDKEDRA